MTKLWWVQADALEHLQPLDFHRLQQMTRRACYEAGKVVYSSALPGDVIYLIQQGQVTLFQSTGSDARRKLVQLQAGDVFGSLSVIEVGYKHGQVLTDSTAALLVMRKKGFEQLMKYYPGTGTRLVAYFQAQMQAQMQERNQWTLPTTTRRLHRLLQHFVNNPAYQLNGEQVPFQPDLRELAELLACRPEVVKLSLDKLEAQGLISRKAQKIELLT